MSADVCFCSLFVVFTDVAKSKGRLGARAARPPTGTHPVFTCAYVSALRACARARGVVASLLAVAKLAESEGADREASNELFSRDFSDEKEIHSTPASSGEHANTVRDRFRHRVRSSWFGGLLGWRVRTSCHTASGCARNAFANSHPVSTFCSGSSSAPVSWYGHRDG